MLKRKRLKADEVQQALATFAVIPIKEVEVELSDALVICAARDIYAYDAYYLEAAKRRSRPIMTLDARMAEVATVEGIKLEEI